MTTQWKRFEDWHHSNSHVWPLFIKFAFQAVESGRVRFSARNIIHRIRWYTNVETVNDDFKINDHWSPYYARIFMRVFPQFAGLFEVREADTDPEVETRLLDRMRAQTTSSAPKVQRAPRPEGQSAKRAVTEVGNLYRATKRTPSTEVTQLMLWVRDVVARSA